MEMTDNELTVKCLDVLTEKFGSVDAERFVAIVNRDRFDYTEWRRDNLFVDETVDSLFEKIKAYEEQEAAR